ncbi:hypothetical protein MtrunA17_Chr2g0302871 [Medicago truncatula]|uniref:Uncharacterized protein n=1 Tax=Medicago truncatula TaxID=3880 RepID=A0A396JBK1_MEDTR|nr:hypothetical protein MtrunA17_Chr2g0302871 [Medicago truncatula]
MRFFGSKSSFQIARKHVSTLIKYQIIYHLNSFDFADFWAWFVSFGKKVECKLTHVGANVS